MLFPIETTMMKKNGGIILETSYYTDGETFNWKEELANAITHGIGFLLSIPALVVLIVSAVNNGLL